MIKRGDSILHISLFDEKVNNAEFQYWHLTGESLNVNLHNHNHYECIIALTDGVIHKINGEKHKLYENTLLFIRPNDIHGFSASVKKCEFICFSFTEKAFRRFISYMDGTEISAAKLLTPQMPPLCRLLNYQRERLCILMQDLSYVESEYKSITDMRFRLLLTEIIGLFFENDYQRGKSAALPEWLETTCSKMKLRENFCIGLAKMTELSEKTPEHLSRATKKYLGITPTEYINDIRLRFAANQLLSTSDSVLDICLDAGFQNTVYFHKKFKEKFGKTPLQFRKKSI